MNLSVITTFNQAGYTKYAQKMIQTFLATWPTDVTLYAYAEDCNVIEIAPNLVVVDLHKASPALVAFKDKWSNVPKANGDISSDITRSIRLDSKKSFKWDAVRFAHKVYAIFDCAKKCNSDMLLWMDADTICHSPITMSRLKELIPADKELCFLGREGKYTECGLYAMNLHSPMITRFLESFQRMYDHAEQGIFTLAEWHDSFVFDEVRHTLALIELNWSKNIIKGEGHPLINSEWGAYLDHLKGDRKSLGRSKLTDLKIIRTESYWSK
jgi:hypothetical protein